MKYVIYGVVLLSGCVITEILKGMFSVSVGGDVPFMREFFGFWLGPALTGWSLGFMMRPKKGE